MVVLILVFVLFISYFFFLAQNHNFNILYQGSALTSNYLNDIETGTVKVVNLAIVDSVNSEKEIVDFDTNIIRTKKALQKNLNHLEFIITIEESLVSLAANDRCNAIRLEEYLKVKKEVQLKIIELTTSLSFLTSK